MECTILPLVNRNVFIEGRKDKKISMKGRRDTKMRGNLVQTIRNSTKDREGISTRDRGGKYYED